jgi:acetate---CoA ligase (ADP-forming)
VAFVHLPADSVTAARRDLDQRAVRSAVVIGNGFKLSHSAARQDLVQFLGSPGRGLRLVGPNCVGTMSPPSGAHLNFSGVLQTTPARAGSAALVTQSGTTGNGILVSLLHRGAGLSHCFSTGDELEADALEVTADLLPRPEVSYVGLLIEGIDIDWLPEVRQAMNHYGKQVFVVKVADTDLGRMPPVSSVVGMSVSGRAA